MLTKVIGLMNILSYNSDICYVILSIG